MNEFTIQISGFREGELFIKTVSFDYLQEEYRGSYSMNQTHTEMDRKVLIYHNELLLDQTPIPFVIPSDQMSQVEQRVFQTMLFESNPRVLVQGIPIKGRGPARREYVQGFRWGPPILGVSEDSQLEQAFLLQGGVRRIPVDPTWHTRQGLWVSSEFEYLAREIAHEIPQN